MRPVQCRASSREKSGWCIPTTCGVRFHAYRLGRIGTTRHWLHAPRTVRNWCRGHPTTHHMDREGLLELACCGRLYHFAEVCPSGRDISVAARAWCVSGSVRGETLRHEVIDRSESISILCSGPSAPNGGRSSVRMGVQLDDTHT